MNTELLLSDRRFRWISTMYFYVTANADRSINPFKNLVDFLEVKVGDLLWGSDKNSRITAKSKICEDFKAVMEIHGYKVSKEELQNCLSDDEMSNEKMAQHLAGIVKVA